MDDTKELVKELSRNVQTLMGNCIRLETTVADLKSWTDKIYAEQREENERRNLIIRDLEKTKWQTMGASAVIAIIMGWVSKNF